MEKFTHLDKEGRPRMVDVGEKNITSRIAIAEGYIEMSEGTAQAVKENTLKKGNVLVTAELAGVMAAKRTHELIPLCHQLELTGITVKCAVEKNRVKAHAEVTCRGRTGVEMEALQAVSEALLTVYDMCKAVEKSMTINGIRLLRKSGGKSGTYAHEE